MAPLYGRPGRRRRPAGPARGPAQTSVASTSTRSRAAGRGTAARASAMTVGSGARTIHRSASSWRHRAPTERHPSSSAKRPAPGPRSSGHRAEGRQAELPAQRPLRPGQQTRVGVHGRRQRLVAGHPGLDQHPPAAGAGTDQPGGPGQQGQRLLAGTEPGGQQVLVDVQEGDHVGPADPVQRRLGPDHQAGPRPPIAGSDAPVISTAVDAGEGGQLLGGPGHPDPQRLEPGGVAHGAHRRPGLPAPSAHQSPGRLVLGHRPAAPGAAGQRPALAAGQQPDPPGPVEDADHPSLRGGRAPSAPARPAARRTARCGDRRRCGRPPRPPASPGARPPGSWSTSRHPSVTRTSGGHGETSSTGAPSRRARSTATSTADQVGERSSR